MNAKYLFEETGFDKTKPFDVILQFRRTFVNLLMRKIIEDVDAPPLKSIQLLKIAISNAMEETSTSEQLLQSHNIPALRDTIINIMVTKLAEKLLPSIIVLPAFDDQN